MLNNLLIVEFLEFSCSNLLCGDNEHVGCTCNYYTLLFQPQQFTWEIGMICMTLFFSHHLWSQQPTMKLQFNKFLN